MIITEGDFSLRFTAPAGMYNISKVTSTMYCANTLMNGKDLLCQLRVIRSSATTINLSL